MDYLERSELIDAAIYEWLEGASDQILENVIDDIDEFSLFSALSTVRLPELKELVEFFRVRKPELFARTMVRLGNDIKEQIVDMLGFDTISGYLSLLPQEGVARFMELLDEDVQQKLLLRLSSEVRQYVLEWCSYPQDSIKRLMSKNFLTVPCYWTVEMVTSLYRRRGASDIPFPSTYYLIVVEADMSPVGLFPAVYLLFSKQSEKVVDLMIRRFPVVRLFDNPENLGNIFQGCGSVIAPVVNHYGHLVGVISIHDMIEFMQKTIEEDVLHLGQVSNNDVQASVFSTITRRMPWLAINFGTATLSSMVVGAFSDTIQKVVELSVIFPIIASTSGNAGLQAVTVTVRALAKGLITDKNAFRLILKECVVGFSNGVAMAIIAFALIVLRFHNFQLEVLTSVSVIIVFSVASVIGTIIPLVVHKLKGDPTLSSSILMCASTDALSFFVFLGLATLFLI